MGIFTDLRNAFYPVREPPAVEKSGTQNDGQVVNDPTNWSSSYSLSYPSFGALFGWGSQFKSDTGQIITDLSSLQSRAVYACVKCLSEDMAKLPIRIRRKLPTGGYAEVFNHPLNRVLRVPNRWQTPFEFWSNMVWSLQLRGNAYAYIRRARNGDVKELIFIHPDKARLLPPVNGKLYYVLQHRCLRDGQDINCSAEDVLHIKNQSIDGGFTGVSPIMLCQTIVALDICTRTHAATMFRQGTALTGLLKHPGPGKLSDVALNNLRAGWQAAFGGVQKSHQVAVVQEGMEFQPISMNAMEAQLLEARKANTEEIASLFRVPLHKIGVLDHATFSNIEDQGQSYVDDALMAIAKRIEEHLEVRCLRTEELADHEVRFDFDMLLRGNSVMRAQANQIKKSNGIISANEWRSSEGMTPSSQPGTDGLKSYENLAGKGPPESLSSTNPPKSDQ